MTYYLSEAVNQFLNLFCVNEMLVFGEVSFQLFFKKIFIPSRLINMNKGIGHYVFNCINNEIMVPMKCM